MVEIKNTQVYNLKEAVVASGNAMRFEPEEITNESFDKSIERCTRLAKNGGGSGHTNFRTGILVTFDLKYPQYFSKQIQRYHFFQYVSSTSMMHRITKMDFSKCCNRYVSEAVKRNENSLIEFYNLLVLNKNDDVVWNDLMKDYIVWINSEYEDTITPSLMSKDDVLYDLYMRIISNCPMGAELWVHCSTNYEQLATIYKQRKNHKLKEDWGTFCKWIESLPYAKELIICE